MMSDRSIMPVRVEISGGVALVLIDIPPVNATSQAVRQGLLDAVRMAETSPEVDAVVIACEGRTFVAGGDIKEFGKPPLAPALCRAWTVSHREQSIRSA